jgi:hypothetical protein
MRSNQSLQDVLGLAAAVRRLARNERRSRRAPEPSVAKDRRLVAVPAHSAPDEEVVAGPRDRLTLVRAVCRRRKFDHRPLETWSTQLENDETYSAPPTAKLGKSSPGLGESGSGDHIPWAGSRIPPCG